MLYFIRFHKTAKTRLCAIYNVLRVCRVDTFNFISDQYIAYDTAMAISFFSHFLSFFGSASAAWQPIKWTSVLKFVTYCFHATYLYSLIDKSYWIVCACVYIWHAEICLRQMCNKCRSTASSLFMGLKVLNRAFFSAISPTNGGDGRCMKPKQNISGTVVSYTHTATQVNIHTLRARSGCTENRNSRIYRSLVNAHDNSLRTKLTPNILSDWSWAKRHCVCVCVLIVRVRNTNCLWTNDTKWAPTQIDQKRWSWI